MKQIMKKNTLLGLLLFMGLLLTNNTVNAQTPDDDPGIGGPGSGGSSPGLDGGPIVPLDRDLSIALIAVGIAFGYKKMKEKSLLTSN